MLILLKIVKLHPKRLSKLIKNERKYNCYIADSHIFDSL